MTLFTISRNTLRQCFKSSPCWTFLRKYSFHHTPIPSESTCNKDPPRKKTTLSTLRNMYKKGIPITMLTAYDYPTAISADEGGADVVLVGDSLAMVALGHPNTNSLTMEEMIHHCKAVSRGTNWAFKLCDMPYGSYETSTQEAIKNAIRLIKVGHIEAVKLEGGKEMADTVHNMTAIGIPVVGHIGLTPQRQNALGGFRVQGKRAELAMVLVEDALTLQEAGCSMLVIEAVPEVVAEAITQLLSIPTIGIGAGVHCSGQVLVQQDMLGAFDRFTPKFCKQYAKVGTEATTAIKAFANEVKTRMFPQAQHCYPMEEAEKIKFLQSLSTTYPFINQRTQLQSIG